MSLNPSPAVLALASGDFFEGISMGYEQDISGEVVFNTSMTGYQEILSDPSYHRQLVAMTYPHIGNVGSTQLDMESNVACAGGLIVRSLSQHYSNWRAEGSLSNFLHEKKIPAISEIDTRKLTHILREKGSQLGCISIGQNVQKALKVAQNLVGLETIDDTLVSQVSSSSKSQWSKGLVKIQDLQPSTPQPLAITVGVLDCGIKNTIMRMLVERGLRVQMFPHHTSLEELLHNKISGVLLSNGPGDPEMCTHLLPIVQKIINSGMPVFGVCLGAQLMALAEGSQTIKMKFGHHGANHPVLELETGRVMVTSQNHGFVVDRRTLKHNMKETHISLFDNSLQGFRWIDRPAFAFQGHPEASPGPHDISHLFDHFHDLLTQHATSQ